MGSGLCDVKSGKFTPLGAAADGPIGFRADGTPLQLAQRKKENDLVLLDLANGKILMQFEGPAGATLAEDSETAMLEDGTRVAATAKAGDGKTAILVWDGTSGKQLHALPGAATAMAFSPDGSLLGGANREGDIRVWSPKTGRELFSLRASPTEVHCLAFARDPRRPSSSALRRDKPGGGVYSFTFRIL